MDFDKKFVEESIKSIGKKNGVKKQWQKKTASQKGLIVKS